MLTTISVKTGGARRMPLLGIPIDGDLAVGGSNFGTAATPGWVYNLEGEPRGDRWVPPSGGAGHSRADDPAESEQAFDLASAVYGAFPAYRERAAHRDVRVFILEPL